MAAYAERSTEQDQSRLRDLRDMPRPRRARAEQAAISTAICVLMYRVGSPAWHEFVARLWIITSEFDADGDGTWYAMGVCVYRMRLAMNKPDRTEHHMRLRQIVMAIYTARANAAFETWQSHLPENHLLPVADQAQGEDFSDVEVIE